LEEMGGAFSEGRNSGKSLRQEGPSPKERVKGEGANHLPLQNLRPRTRWVPFGRKGGGVPIFQPGGTSGFDNARKKIIWGVGKHLLVLGKKGGKGDSLKNTAHTKKRKEGPPNDGRGKKHTIC